MRRQEITMNDSIISALKAQAAERVAILKSHSAMTELVKLHSAINHLEDLESIPRTTLAQLFGLEGGAEVVTPVTVVRPGRYLGKNAMEAAKDFLNLRQTSATLD